MGRKLILLLLCILLFPVFTLPAQDLLPGGGEIHPGEIRWYRSNSSGMALELIPSRLAALRYEYALSVQTINSRELPGILPEILLPYFENFHRVELRLLYKEGTENRRQWIFRDPRGITRLAASGNAVFFAGDNQPINDVAAENAEAEDSDEEIPEEIPKKENRSGFIEIRDSEGIPVREFQYDADLSEWEYRYFHRGSALLRTEIWFKEAPVETANVETANIEEASEEPGDEEPEGEELEGEQETALEIVPLPVDTPQEERKEPVFVLAFTDYYRYTRSGSLRAIDRTIHEGAADKVRVGFPGIGPSVSTGIELAIYGGSYTASHFIDAGSLKEVTISYSIDNRGRILSEIVRNEDGKVIGELRNVWTDDRIQSITWKAGDDERLIEFEYDRAGNPTVERNLRKGVLERSVTIEGNTETEEIYMNGRLVLRAHWENGLKISEERIFSSGGGPR